MLRPLQLLIAIFFCTVLTSSLGEASEEINIDTLDISEKARALLKKEQKHWCNSIEEGINTFSFESNPVTSIILGMDGEEAEIIEYNKFKCKVGWGRNGGGSGGYPLALIIEDVIYDLNLVNGGWHLINLEGSSPVLLLSRHGTFCNLSGTYACLQALKFRMQALFFMQIQNSKPDFRFFNFLLFLGIKSETNL